MTRQELETELHRARVRLSLPGSAKTARQWHKRIHSFEAELARRD